MNSNLKPILVWVGLISSVVLLFIFFYSNQGRREVTVPFTELIQKVQDGQVKEVAINGSEVHGIYVNQGIGFTSQIPPTYDKLYDLLIEKGVAVTIKAESNGGLSAILLSFLPFLALLVVPASGLFALAFVIRAWSRREVA